MNRQTLLESIATTISDYRSGEIPSITPTHVEQWISQFDQDEQLIILSETNSIFSKYYISKEKAKFLIKDKLEKFKSIFNTPEYLPYINFLDIQKKGSSQKELLSLVNEIVINQYGISINDCGSDTLMYVYLDDCLFSGNTVLHDIEAWLNHAKPDTIVYLVFLASYSSGLNYINKKLVSLLKPKSISVEIISCLTFNNLPWNQEKYECLWPQEIDDELVNRFVKIVQENSQGKSVNPRLFRSNMIPHTETLFSSPEARNIVETAFLRKGAYIASLPKKRQLSMRPMGYEYLESLGFGAVFVTYRNIANNCPLVLWWGDTSYPPSHPFSKWYPLFPRKVNESLNTPSLFRDF